MRITKNEKSLWTFLNIFKQIISKTARQVVIFGNEGKLIIDTLNYAGVFAKSKQGLFEEYEFRNSYYELLQLPNGDYVLDELVEQPIERDERNEILKNISNSIDYNEWILSLEKSDINKIAKIATYTKLWINDNDVKYLNAVNQMSVYKCDYNNDLLFDIYGLTNEDIASVRMILIMKKLETSEPVQQKMDLDDLHDPDLIEKQADELIEETESELEDEFEDEFDPMLA